MRSKGYSLLGVGLLLALLLGPSFAVWGAEAELGRLQFKSMSHDFGAVYRGAQLMYRFEFTNVGSGPLSLQGVHAACGCTAVGLDKNRRYQPGEQGAVDIKLDTTDFAGPLVKVVTVISDEKLLPDRTLTLRAFVKTEIEADPPLIDFGEVSLEQNITRSVNIKPIAMAKAAVKELVYNTDILSVMQQPRQDGGVDLTVALKPDIKPSFLKETIVVKNTSKHLPEMMIPVRANIKGNIGFSPSYVEFGAIAPSDSAKRFIALSGSSDFNVEGVRTELLINGRKVSPSEGHISIDTKNEDGKKKQVSLELKNRAGLAGSVHGKLVIETTDPRQKEVNIDFYGFFR